MNKKLLCLLLSAVIMLTGIPVQAADFGDVFTSGEVQTDFGSGEADIPDEDIVQVPVVTPTVTPSVTPEPSGTEEEDIEVFVQDEMPAEEDASAEMAGVATAGGASAMEAAEAVSEEDKAKMTPLTVKFVNVSGNGYYEELQLETNIGGTFTVPNVPGRIGTEGNVWKVSDEPVDITLTTFVGGSKALIAVSELDVWEDYISNGVLTLYPLKEYRVTLMNNSGTAVFNGGILTAFEGNNVTLPEFATNKYYNYGWTKTKSGTKTEYKIGSQFTVTKNTTLYMVRKSWKWIKFLDQNGSGSSAMTALNKKIVNGTYATIPKVPSKTGYQALGWATRKNYTRASSTYAPGKKIKVTKDITLYAVYKRLPYTVTFNNNKGTSKSSAYTSLTTYAAKNQTITLPAVPKLKGYRCVGWTTKKGSSKAMYKAGAKVKITKSTRFYGVYKKSRYYTVTYCYGNGKTNSAYKRLTMKVEENTTITFPTVPSRSGYVNLGWSTRKNPTKATTRKTYVVKKNLTFYAVQKKNVKVTLLKNNGTAYVSKTLAQGGRYKLPSVKNASGYTFMGWSTKAYQSVNPQYQPEDIITVDKSITLYAVVYNTARETNIGVDTLAQADPRYKKVIFVGDSRTVMMKQALDKLNNTTSIDLMKNLEFICESGMGLDWFKSTGYAQLLQSVGNRTVGPLEKRTKVIFNLGVNDYKNLNSYVVYMNSIAKTLKDRGCDLYYMSVNPFNRTMAVLNGKTDRSVASVRNFNARIKSSLGGQYTFINTYDYLMKTGYNTFDGLHYSETTSKRIYQYCMKAISPT